MKSNLTRLLADYGMVVVLLLLCLFFSAVTYTEQSATGPAAIKGMVGSVQTNDSVLIATGPSAEDERFVQEVAKQLQSRGVKSVQVTRGTPRDARLLLEKDASVNTVLCGEQSSRWLIFDDLGTELASHAKTRVIKPPTYFYPNFLKTDNLLNIANQIAVIAIVAIGMTMVIIAGGIDLSVGSLIALSAVMVSAFIRDYAGGTEASPVAMTLCCLASIALCGAVGGFTGLMVTRFGIPPFIVTLSMMLVGSGLAYIIAEGQSISVMPDSFVWLGRGADFLSVPNAVVLMFVLYGIAYVLMSQMRLGRYIYAVGGNGEAALISGLPVKRVIATTYVVSGLLTRWRTLRLPAQKRLTDLRDDVRTLRHRRRGRWRNQPQRRKRPHARHAHRRFHHRRHSERHEPHQRRELHPESRPRPCYSWSRPSGQSPEPLTSPSLKIGTRDLHPKFPLALKHDPIMQLSQDSSSRAYSLASSRMWASISPSPR